MLKIGRKQNKRTGRRDDVMVKLCSNWKRSLLYNKKTRTLHFQKQCGELEKRIHVPYGDSAYCRAAESHYIGNLLEKYKKYPWWDYADYHKDTILEMLRSYFNIIEGMTKAIR
tara:strand:+ start:17402 stop:17740 length:339 start_codon:yes stop_codon:yes gene_type:complete